MGIFSRSSKRKIGGKGKKNKTPLLPAAVQSFIAHRLTDTVGTGFAVLGGALMLALGSYHAKDPSLNTATAAEVPVQNLLGAPGAYTADLLLQTLQQPFAAVAGRRRLQCCHVCPPARF